MKILEDAVKNNYTSILVFEDDIIFRKDFNKHLEKQYSTIIILIGNYYIWVVLIMDYQKI